MSEVEGAEVHGEGGEHKGRPLWNPVPLDHHVLLSYPAAHENAYLACGLSI